MNPFMSHEFHEEFYEYAWSLGLPNWKCESLYDRVVGGFEIGPDWRNWVKSKAEDTEGRIVHALEALVGEVGSLTKEVARFRETQDRNSGSNLMRRALRMGKEVSIAEAAQKLGVSSRTIQRHRQKAGKNGPITETELGELKKKTTRKRPDVAGRNKRKKSDRRDVLRNLEKTS